MHIEVPAGGDACSAQGASEAALQLLCLIAHLHHIAADPATLAHQLGLSPSENIDANQLLLVAGRLGLKAASTQVKLDWLSNTPLPALAQCTDGRWVLVAACTDGKVLLQYADSERAAEYAVEEFRAAWLGEGHGDRGEMLLFTSRSELAGDWSHFDISWFIPSLVRHRKLLGEVLLVSVFLQLFALVTPLFFQVVVDKALVHNGLSTLNLLVVGLLEIGLFESLLSVLRTYVFSHTCSRIDAELGMRLFRHLLQLPLAWFQHRRVGDSVARVRELENIRSFLTGQALTVVLDVVFSLVFIAVMLCYSLSLTTIVLLSIPAYLLLSVLVIPVLRKRLQEKFSRGTEQRCETASGSPHRRL